MTGLRKTVVMVAVVSGLLVSGHGASAQRTAKGERETEVCGLLSGTRGAGFRAGAGVYAMKGMWDVSVSGVFRPYVFDGGDAVLGMYTAGAGYRWRLASTRSRSLNLYGGGGVFLGAGVLSSDEEGWAALSASMDEETDSLGSFVYGLGPKLEAEWFPFRTAALVLSLSAPFTICASGTVQSLAGLVSPELGLGLRVDF